MTKLEEFVNETAYADPEHPLLLDAREARGWLCAFVKKVKDRAGVSKSCNEDDDRFIVHAFEQLVKELGLEEK